MSLYGRKVVVSLNGTKIERLDVRFRIEKSLDQTPNVCDLQIFNMSKDNRARVESGDPVHVRVEAGYESGQGIGLVFEGDLRVAYNVHKSPDWVTTLKSGDAEEKCKTARVSKSYTKGTPVSTVLRDVIQAYGVGVGNSDTYISKAAFRGSIRKLAKGLVVAGPASSALGRLLAAAGLEHSVQDGVLQILDIGKALNRTAVVLGSDTGMIGSPSLGAKGRTKIRSLLQAELFPGRKIQVKSRAHPEGKFYRVEKALYTGDLTGDEWYVDVEAGDL